MATKTKDDELANRLRGLMSESDDSLAQKLRQEISGPVPQDINVQELIYQMGGQLPFEGTEQELLTHLQSTTDPRFGGAGRHPELVRRDAYQQLLDAGYTQNDIVSALAYEQAIQPPDKTGQLIGSTAAGILASKLIPGPADDVAIASGLAKKMGIGQRLFRAGARSAAEGVGGVVGSLADIAVDPDREFNEAQMKRVMAEESAYGLGGEALAFSGRTALRPVRKFIPGTVDMNRRLIEMGKQAGMGRSTHLLPAEMSENRLIDTLQGIAEGGLIDWGQLPAHRKALAKLSGTAVIEESSEVLARGARNMTPTQLRDLMLDVIEERGVSHGEVATKLYEGVGEAIGPGKVVNLGRTGMEAQRLLTRAEAALGIGETDVSMKLMKRVADVENMSGGIVDFETAKDIRSRLLKLARAAGSKVNPDPQTTEVVSRLVTSVDEAMEAAAKEAGPEAEKAWRRANWYYRAGKERYHNKLLNKLIHELPDNPEASRAIFRNEQNIIRAKKALGPDKFQIVKKAWYDSLVQDSMLKTATDVTQEMGISEPLGAKILKAYNSVGQASLDAAFSKTEQKIIRDNALMLATVQAKTGGHSGALRFVQGAALVGVLASPLYADQPGGTATTATNIGVVIGPSVLAKLMTKRGFAKWLSEGYRAPEGTQQAVKAAARLARNVFQARMEVANERRKARKRAELPTIQRQIEQDIAEARRIRGSGAADL